MRTPYKGMASPETHINLVRGWPSPDLLPAGLISSAAQQLLADQAISTPVLQYGLEAGYPALRVGLAQWLGRHYQVPPDSNRICVTGGASQSISNILASFTDPIYTRAVWVVAPCYFLACAMFHDGGFEGRLKAIAEDDEGIDLSALDQRLEEFEREEKRSGKRHNEQPVKHPGPHRKLYRHVIYAVPTCSNPSGTTMSVRRREGLVKLARKYDALVICDDVYDFLQWPINSEVMPDRPDNMRLPRLCDIDRAMGKDDNDPRGFGHAISNGSFSKLAGPGMRTGWVESSPAFVTGLAQTASTRSGGAPSQFSAAIMSKLVDNGKLEEFIDKETRVSLQRRHRIILEALEKYVIPYGNIMYRKSNLAGADIYGGYFVWITLNLGVSSRLVADIALEKQNLLVGHGNMFAVPGDETSDQFDRDIRLCFAWEPEEVVAEGVRRLGTVLEDVQSGAEFQRTNLTQAQLDARIDSSR